MSVYSLMSDAELDNVYAAANRKTKVRATLTQGMQEMAAAADEIVSRNGWSFMASIRGVERFPQYAAIVGHSQVDAARSSVKENVAIVEGGIGGAIGKLLGPAVPFLIAAGVLVALWKFKK